MLSVDILRELWEGVVTSHKDGITFFSRWSDVLDTGNDEHHPKVLWKPPTVALVPNGYGCDQTFTVDLIFLDNTASDRDSDTRDGTYERMTILAAHQHRQELHDRLHPAEIGQPFQLHRTL